MQFLPRFIKGFLITLALGLMLSMNFDGAGANLGLALIPNAQAQTNDDPLGNLGQQSPEDLVGEEAFDAETDKLADELIAETAADVNPQEFDEIVTWMPDTPSPQDAKNSEDIIRQVANLATKSHRIFAPLINYFSFHIGNFLGNDYIYQGSMGKMLHKIWIISRNLVNILFVFLLLWIAIREIFFIGEESDLKKKLISFTLLLIAVNFTWLGTKVVLDAASVATHVVFAIPSGISGDVSYQSGNLDLDALNLKPCQVNTLAQKPIEGACVPSAVISPTEAGSASVLYWEDKGEEGDNCSKMKEAYDDAYLKDGSRNLGAKEENRKFWGKTSICMENLNLTRYDQNTATIYLTYGMARIQNLINATAGDDAVQLSVSVLMSLVIQIVYSIALIALFFALIFRMMMLWLLVAFSPLLVLTIWFKENSAVSNLSSYFSISAFLNWAFIPVKVGAIFVVSFIMISAGQSIEGFTTSLQNKGGFIFRIIEPQSMFMGIESLQFFLWLLMSVVVLWMGVFTVLSTTGIGAFDNIVGRVKEAGKAVAVKVGTAPYWAPILPLGKGGAPTSVKEAVQTVSPLAKLDEAYRKAGGAPDELRRLNARAPRVDFGKIEQDLTASNFKLSYNQANSIAKDYGFNDVKHLLEQDQGVVKAAMRKSRGYKQGSNFDEKLYTALSAHRAGPISKEAESAEAKAQRRRETREDIASGTKAGQSPQAPSAGGAPSTAPTQPRPGGGAGPA